MGNRKMKQEKIRIKGVSNPDRGNDQKGPEMDAGSAGPFNLCTYLKPKKSSKSQEALDRKKKISEHMTGTLMLTGRMRKNV